MPMNPKTREQHKAEQSRRAVERQQTQDKWALALLAAILLTLLNSGLIWLLRTIESWNH
jgi:hypothetical protein